MSLAYKLIYSQRPLVTSPYLKGKDATLRPLRPIRCSSEFAGEDCQIKFNGSRPRKCGIGHPLVLARCKVHKVTFTVYPPGWTPFSRRINADVSLAGFDIEGGVEGLESWTHTSFGAAVDAEASRIWPASSSGIKKWSLKHGIEPYGVAKTQRRHIAGINSLFALSTHNSEDQAKVVATLGVNLSVLAQESGRVRDGPEIVAEGSKGAAVLSALGKSSRRLLPGITRLGFDRGYWGPQV
jgi:hypothetical protein